MISKNRIRQIQALNLKKHRDASHSFVAEGPKVVADLLASPFRCLYVAATAEWLATHGDVQADTVEEVTPSELERASLLRAPQQVLAIFQQPDVTPAIPDPSTCLMLALDNIQDPGNVGTIVRLADWFGIRHLICSPTTADVFAPKVVQATMGALARVSVHYLDLSAYLSALPPSVPVYGTFLDGTDIYTQTLSDEGLIVMGNEGRGISPDVARAVNRRLYIPNYPPGEPTSESLNVAVATAVVCAEFRRRSVMKS